MEFKEQKCPFCGGVLQVPDDLVKLTCMYCSKEVNAAELISFRETDSSQLQKAEEELIELWKNKEKDVILKAEKLLEEDAFNHTANQILAAELFSSILLNQRALMRQFKGKLYDNAVIEYMKHCKPILTYLERACITNPVKKDTIIKENAESLIIALKEHINQDKNLRTKSAKSTAMDDYRMVTALFTIPVILELNLTISDPLADSIIEVWKEEYPKNLIKKGTYKTISGGFRKRGFCYITTAVCESLRKEEDCYELVMFRAFRDNYLLKQPGGEVLIQEYYRKAPIIVNNINARKNSSEIYQSIWQNYLSGCLQSIEAGEEEQCKTDYSRMMGELELDYYNC